MLTGLVVSISNGIIKLDLVKPADTTSSGTATPSPSASGGATAQSPSSVTIGTTVYVKTTGSISVTVPSTAAIILGNKGYVSGTLSDIAVGDFLAVSMNGELAMAVIDNGPGTSGTGTTPVQPGVSPGTSPGTSQDSGQLASYFVSAEVNVRSGPSTNDAILGKLQKGIPVTGTITNGWLKFTYKEQVAYVKADYLTTTPPADGGNTAVGAPDSSQTTSYYVTSDELNARSGPDTSATSLGKLTKGQKVTGTITNGWLKFTYSNATAYCSAAYLSTTAPSATSPSASPSPSPSIVPDSNTEATYTVTIEGLNVRSSPDTSSTSLGRLPKGQKVTGTVSGGWLKFTYSNQTAYCYGQYLTKD
jgi:uncharacterized protein YgiM (DUF1202 family)